MKKLRLILSLVTASSMLTACSWGGQYYQATTTNSKGEIEVASRQIAYVCEAVRFAGADLFRYDCQWGQRVEDAGSSVKFQILPDSEAQVLGLEPRIGFWTRFGLWILLAPVALAAIGNWVEDRGKRRTRASTAETG